MEEMRDAEALIDRVLYLEGIPNLQRLGTIRIGESVPEQLRLALDQEILAITRLNDGIALCSTAGTTAAATCWRRSSRVRRATSPGSKPELQLLGALGEVAYLSQQLGH